MRKSNSIFKTAFVSESGAELTNNDYFGYVEYDEYACYILASGITDFESSAAAKEAVEHLILSFEENPSMSKSTLLRYMNETNERLFNSAHTHRLKASVIMVVTDYEKFRYVSAGNVRLRMYRQGRFLLASKDMSLASDLVEKDLQSETVLDKHEERHNLYAYLGKKDFFKPYVSKVEKLEDTDIITLYSQGLWENVDSQEIDDVFSEANDDPQESVDFLEEVLLSRQPQDLKSYTIVAIFINKAFRDPERERKRLFYIKVAIITLIVIIIISIIAYLFYSWRQKKVEELDKLIAVTEEYMSLSNYKRAQENCQEAIKLAKDLKDIEKETDLQHYLLLCDEIVEGDELIFNDHYSAAYVAFRNAQRHTTGNDSKVYDYIHQRLSQIQVHISVEEFLSLGDNALKNKDYDEAEGMYLQAREKAALIYDMDSQQRAVQGIEKIYDEKAKIQAAKDKETADKKQMAMSEEMKKGDELLAKGDLEGAQEAYLNARNLSDNPADKQFTTNSLAQVTQAKEKKEMEEKSTADALKDRAKEASDLEAQGDKSFSEADYLTAEMYYMRAMESFKDLHDDLRLENVQKKYEATKLKYFENRGKKMQAEDTETTARDFYANKNFKEAQSAATQAKNLYLEMGMKDKADAMDVLLQQIATDAAISETLK